MSAFPKDSAIQLDWWQVNETSFSGYFVYRSDASEGPYDTLNETPFDSTTYQDIGLTVGEEFWYYVTAITEDGCQSPPSSIVHAKVGEVHVWMPDIRAPASTDLQTSQVRLPININNADGIYTSIDVHLTFPDHLLDTVGFETTALTREFQFDQTRPAPNRLQFAAVDLQGKRIVGEGHLLDVLFTVNRDLAEGTNGVTSFTDDGVGIDISMLLNGVPRILRLEDSDRDLSRFTVSRTGILGDMNCDGFVTAYDAVLAAYYAVGIDVSEEICSDVPILFVGDVNGDARIDSADVILILRMAAGRPINPPQGGQQKTARVVDREPYSLEIISATTPVGQEFTLPVRIANGSEDGFAGLDLHLNFDESRLEPISVTQVGWMALFDYQHISNLVDPHRSPGELRVSLSRKDNLARDDAYLDLRFRVRPTVAPGEVLTLDVAGAKLSRQYGENLEWQDALVLTGGEVAVISPYLNDFNNDGRLDFLDLFELSSEWQSSRNVQDILGLMEGKSR